MSNNCNKRPGAIITGGDHQGLGVFRSLAKRNIPIILLDNDHCIGRFSRYKKLFFYSPPPSEHEAYFDFLIQLSKKENLKNWVIFPNSDEIAYILSKNKAILNQYYKIPTPDWEVVKYIYVKKNTYQLAQKNGIPIPKTFFPIDLNELLSLDINYPVVLKPSIRDHFYNKIKIKAFKANNKTEVQDSYLKLTQYIPPEEVLVQEFIPGGPNQLYSFCPFFKNGKALFGISARRARQHPMDFGHASTFAEIVDIPILKQISEKFLNLINYYGLAEVEFMLDPSDNQFKLIEINPRIWGWHTLAIAAGVDLPYIQFLDMTNQALMSQPTVRPMKWVRLITDVPTVAIGLLNGRIKLKEYIQSMKGEKEFAVFSIKDPLPSFVEIALIPYLWKKRGF
ncbi:MAG: ATP-grasp domain-containing protein [Candidatus Hodarchaeota archaeon]